MIVHVGLKSLMGNTNSEVPINNFQQRNRARRNPMSSLGLKRTVSKYIKADISPQGVIKSRICLI